MKKLIDKKEFKLSAGKCRICGCGIYETLDCHRINPGENGGKYTSDNVVVVCASCHRKIHAGCLKIFRYILCSDGTYKLHIEEDGKEFFL